jgi:hypothetical protein
VIDHEVQLQPGNAVSNRNSNLANSAGHALQPMVKQSKDEFSAACLNFQIRPDDLVLRRFYAQYSSVNSIPFCFSNDTIQWN